MNASQVTINGRVIDFTLMVNAIITFIIGCGRLLLASSFHEQVPEERRAADEADGRWSSPEIRDLLAGNAGQDPPQATGASG